MLVSFRWTQTSERNPQISRQSPVSQTLLARLALATAFTAYVTIPAPAARAASFDETVDADAATSVLLHEPGSVPLDTTAVAEHDPVASNPGHQTVDDVTSFPLNQPVGCTGLGGASCACPSCLGAGGSSHPSSQRGPATGLIGTLRGFCSDRLCADRGPLADCDPPGVFQQIADRHADRGACWTVRAESILLWRDAPNSRPLMTTFDAANQTLGPTVFDANQLQSDMLVAPRITVSRLQECGRGVEASYLYAGNFYANRSLPVAVDGYAFAAPGIFGNDWGIDGTPISVAQQQVLANLQSGEINFREPLGWGANRFLIGFRWLQWWESWRMVDGFQDPTDPTVTGFDDYQSQCTNNLYGGQIGFDSVLWNRGQGLRLESLVKAGAYYNNVNGSSSYDYATSDGFAFSRQLTRGGPPGAAFVGEVGLTAVVPLRKNFDLRCGYFGLWLEGLAQPTNQLSNQTLTQIDPPAGTLTTKGSAVLQGLSLGLEGRW